MKLEALGNLIDGTELISVECRDCTRIEMHKSDIFQLFLREFHRIINAADPILETVYPSARAVHGANCFHQVCAVGAFL